MYGFKSLIGVKIGDPHIHTYESEICLKPPSLFVRGICGQFQDQSENTSEPSFKVELATCMAFISTKQTKIIYELCLVPDKPMYEMALLTVGLVHCCIRRLYTDD